MEVYIQDDDDSGEEDMQVEEEEAEEYDSLEDGYAEKENLANPKRCHTALSTPSPFQCSSSVSASTHCSPHYAA